MNYHKKIRWLNLLVIALTFTPLQLFSQVNITRIEYYVDVDPGLGKASTNGIVFTPAPSVDVSFTLSVTGISPGLHVIGVRSMDENRTWSMDEKWLVYKPVSGTATPNLIQAEYYVDRDLGYGNGNPITINPGKNLNLSFTTRVDTLSVGLHVIGVRTKDANGSWSLDQQWLVAKTAPVIPNVNIVQAEYYVDTDAGFGKCTPIPLSPGLDIPTLSFTYDVSALPEGLHTIGMRSKDANGAWSLDNIWIFKKQESLKAPPQLRYVEYYIDADPGYAKATPVAIDPVTNLANYNIPVNISGLSAGTHGVYFRSRDANGAWNLEDSVKFNIGTVTATPYINVNSISKKTICTGGTVDISFDAKGDFDSTNIFTVQLSNINGNFSNPRIIGSDTGRKSAIITCNIPSNITPGFGYRVRVVSSNVEVTGATGFDTLTVATPPAVPTVTANGPTTFCQGGNVRLTSSPATSYLWSTGDTTRSINVNRSGNYRVIITNPSGCTAVSAVTTVTVNALPDATITASGATNDVCPGKTVTLTASSGTSYLWSNGATTQSIVVSAAGNYIVTVTNENGCSKASAPIAVTYQSCPQPTNLVVSNITSTSARLSWSPPASSCVVGYQEQYRQVGTTEWITLQQVNPAKNITGLLPGTTYQWRVQTGCQQSPPIGSGNVSGTNFTTLTSTLPGIVGANPKLAGSGVFDAVIYPNPAGNTATLSISGIVKDARITLSDAAGKVLWTREHIDVNQLQLPAQQLASGMYFVNVYSNGVFKVLKFVKD